MSCYATGTNGCLDLRHCAFARNGQVSAEWSRCPVFMAWRARNSVTPLRRSLACYMPARMVRLSAGVGRRHPVTIRKASLMVGSMRRVWALRHQTRTQYFAVERTRTGVAVCRVVAPAPQLEPTSHLRSVTRDIRLVWSGSRCRRYMSDLSNVTPRYLGFKQKGKIPLLKLTFSSTLASLLLAGNLATPFCSAEL